MKKIITPVEIQEKEFNKSFRGYDEEEVDMFLDLISLDLEKLIKENLNLKAQIATMKKEKSTIGDSNITVTETLETAKKLMDQLAESSEKRARVLVENAELDAARIVNDARLKAEKITKDSYDLVRNFENLKRDYGNFLEICNKNFEAFEENKDGNKILEFLAENEMVEKEKEKASVTIEKIDRDTIVENIDLEEKIREDAEESEDDPKKTMVNIRYE